MALLLTGAPSVGETTIIQKLAGAYPDKTLRGFVTQEMRRAGRRVGFELRTFGGRMQVLAHVDIDSPHGVGRYGVDIAALDDIDEDALTIDDAADLYLVDEIGKMECFSTKFRPPLRSDAEAARRLVLIDEAFAEVGRRREERDRSALRTLCESGEAIAGAATARAGAKQLAIARGSYSPFPQTAERLFLWLSGRRRRFGRCTAHGSRPRRSRRSRARCPARTGAGATRCTPGDRGGCGRAAGTR